MIGRTSAAYTHPDDVDRNADVVGRIKARETTSRLYEKRYVRPDGTVVHAEVSLSAVRDAAGHAVGAIAVVQDVTDRKLAEAATARDAMLLAHVRTR